MNRRKFLRNGSVAGATVSAVVFGSWNDDPSNKNTNENFSDNFKLNEITVAELQEKMKNGEYSSRAVTEMYLKRIEMIDKSGPAINSVIEINPDALGIADAMDKERKNGKLRGPLHGIPVLIKDNINTGDKMMTTAGALALVGNIASEDAFIVKQLREAGAVLLGKTNLSEWANFRSTRSSSGWSSRGGQTKNPYVLDRNPCGSSSGSGAAVSANLCTIAIGTETNGSIACPASLNGVVGIKPTVGLLSRSGIIPISATQDTAGPLARTLRDAAILLGAIAGIDPNDPATSQSKGKAYKDYTQFLDANGLQGKIIGVEKSFLKGHEAVTALQQKALEILKSKGATIIEVEVVDKLKDLGKAELEVLKYEFKDGVNRYLAKANCKMKSLKDVIEFNKANEAKAMPFFKQELLESSEEKADLNTPAYKEALNKILTACRNTIDEVMDQNKLAAICGPATGPSWCTDLINGDSFTGYGAYEPAAIAGYPSITVPMGMVSQLPVGLSFYSRAYSEPELLKIVYAYEQASKNRVTPEFIKTLNA
jgi:amidase